MSKHLESEASFEASVKGYLYRQWMVRRQPLPADTRLDGQIGIITGSSAGIGLEAARQLLDLGVSHIILSGRTLEKGEKAAEPLRKAHPTAKVEVWPVEMESYKSLAAFAERCRTLPRLDFAVLNAGLNTPERRVSGETGHEQVFQVNCLSTALLAILLLPVLEEKKKRRDPQQKPPVLSIVSSDGALYASIQGLGPVFAELDDPEQFAFPRQYLNSKLALVLFVAKLAEQVDPKKVVVHTVHPGLVGGTDIGRTMAPGWIMSTLLTLLMYPIAQSTPVGASTYVDAVAAKGIESHGSYLSEWSIRPYPPVMYTSEGERLQEKLWTEMMEEFAFADARRIIASMSS
ncbi:Retinol dehydrogenase 14 [Apiospora rasikravindrae]|uniref:Retinol dehydrogenase 14 n=1 Tax=Apiospora rasikravindrae TaxID=990691 RepID=A0ABR1UB76_9PEZI